MMTSRLLSLAFPALSLLSAVKSSATVTLPRIIGSNMVLQRDQPVPIWGWAAVGEKVTVRFGKQEKTAIADASGHWQVTLKSLKASEKPEQMVVAGSNTIVLDNILVGEVWLCSGQSNMEFTMRKSSKVIIHREGDLSKYPTNELDVAKDTGIRIFLVNRKELAKPDSTHKTWQPAVNDALRTFSAAGYFFAKEMRQQLKVPIGVISSAVPGSRIEPWIPKEVYASAPITQDGNGIVKPEGSGDPGKFYEPMIKPLMPFALKGFLWYQGESNCFLGERLEYVGKMKLLIDAWRNGWGNKDLPFYYVQIAPYYYSKSKGTVKLNEYSLPEFREAQALVMEFPHTGMVTTTDLNDNPEDLHPTYKWDVGKRLAFWALAKTYDKKTECSGPIFNKMTVNGNTVELEFTHTGDGLVSQDGKPLSWFEVAGKDGHYEAATAEIKGNKVIVSSSQVSAPVNVRLGWNEAAQPNLYNKVGLPAIPFRTDNPLTLQSQQAKKLIGAIK